MGLIYHYTSPDAALSILRGKKLWFTDCEYLNDPAELDYCYQLLNEAWITVNRELGTPEGQIDRGMFRRSNPYVRDLDIGEDFYIAARYYAACFSRRDDDIGLLSNYALQADHAAYVLAIDREELIGELESLSHQMGSRGVHFEVLHGAVRYDRQKALERIKCMVQEFLAAYRAAPKGSALDIPVSEDVWSLHERLAESLTRISPFIKRQSFSYEQEYRVVLVFWADPRSDALCGGGSLEKTTVAHELPARSMTDGEGAVERYRVGQTGVVVPYVELDLGQRMTRIVKEVCVATGCGIGSARGGVERLLFSEGYRSTQVREMAGLFRL